MNMMALLPMLGLNIPAPVLSIGMKVMQDPTCFNNGVIDTTRIAEVLPKLALEDPVLTKSVFRIGLVGVGASSKAAALASDFVFGNPSGERTEEETQQFVADFRYLNSPEGKVDLPYGCKVCKRIHCSYDEIRLSDTGHPICVRCSREIILNNSGK